MIINQSLDPPGPFGRRVFLAERLPGDRLQEMDLECLVLVLEHLVGQVKHLVTLMPKRLRRLARR